MEILIEVGVLLLIFVSGGFLYNFIVHISYSFYFDKLPERYKNSYMKTHLGNVIAAIISLLIGLAIPYFLKFEFGFNLKTLFILLGFIFPSFMIAIRLDKIETKK
jgi:amino acid transporter